MNYNYKNLKLGCYMSNFSMSAVSVLSPLLFVTFQTSFAIPIEKITLLATLNFLVQLIVDLLAPQFVDRLGYRICVVASQLFAALGLMLLTILPNFIDPFAGILTGVIVYAIGGGLIEVLIGPIMESCPTDNKEKAMSMLHSFYCWGHVGIVLLSTLFFFLFGTQHWRLLTVIWALIPAFNIFMFCNVPLASVVPEGEVGMTVGELFKTRLFWFFMMMMICAGACEQSIVQWVSAFAEEGLGVAKTVGDLAGPLAFAALMGAARLFYGKFGDKVPLQKFMLASSVLCIVSYLLAGLANLPIINLLGCALCGFSVGIMWPGTISQSAAALRRGGTAMFAYLALGGDLGCSIGPSLVGFVASAANNNMKLGIFCAVIFPIILTACLLLRGRKKNA